MPFAPRLVLKLLLPVFVLGAVLAFNPGQAQIASAAPAPEVSDGCTGVPDFGPGFIFSDACAQHDACYAEYGTFLPPTTQSELNRLNCDNAFLVSMLITCKITQPSWMLRLRSACESRAKLYYAGVRLFGGAFFYDEQIHCSAPVSTKSTSVPLAC